MSYDVPIEGCKLHLSPVISISALMTDSLEDKREDYQICAELCTSILFSELHAHTHTHTHTHTTGDFFCIFCDCQQTVP